MELDPSADRACTVPKDNRECSTDGGEPDMCQKCRNQVEVKGTIKRDLEDFKVWEIYDGKRVKFEASPYDKKHHIEQIFEYMQKVPNGSEQAEILRKLIVDETEEIHHIDLRLDINMTKEEVREARTEFHRLVKKNPYMFSKTVGRSGIDVEYSKKKSDLFSVTLEKREKNTIDAVDSVAHVLKVLRKNGSFSGTKDKMGITYQKVVFNAPFDSLVRAQKIFAKENWNIKIYAIERAIGHMKLGEHSGNEFEIVVRNLHPTCETCRISTEKMISTVETRLEHIKNIGFLNLFGAQRFGRNNNNASVGAKLLMKEYDAALGEIMSVGPNDTGDIKNAKLLYAQKKYGEALELIKGWKSLEKRILSELVRGKTAKAILKGLRRELYMLFIHSWQSEKWNALAKKRICEAPKDSPLSALEKDLVMTKSGEIKKLGTLEPEERLGITLFDVFIALCGPEVDTNGYLIEENITPSAKVRGVYRPVLASPSNLSYKFCVDEGQNVVDLQLQFTLKKSTYATTMIDQILRKS